MARSWYKKIAVNYDSEFRFVINIDPKLEPWRALAAEWWSNQAAGKTLKRLALARFLVRYIHDLNLPRSPNEFLRCDYAAPSFLERLELDKEKIADRETHCAVHDFLDWVLKKKLAVRDAQGYPIVGAEYHNPIPALRKNKRTGKTSDPEFRHLTDLDPHLENWRLLATEWFQTQRVSRSSCRTALDKFLIGYIHALKLERNPYHFLRRNYPAPSFCDGLGLPKYGVVYNNHIHEFIAWILDYKLSIDEAGPRHLPIEYHNPVPKRLYAKMMQIETMKSPLPFRYIRELRQMLAQGAFFTDWTWAQAAIETDHNGGDWFVVDPGLIKESDSDCVWRMRRSTVSERKTHGYGDKVIELWSPVRTVALYIKLELPLRTFQVRMLDSGEGDTSRYEKEGWGLNNFPLAKGDDKHPVQRGVFRRSIDMATRHTMTGFYINTNKTADINKEETVFMRKKQRRLTSWPMIFMPRYT